MISLYKGALALIRGLTNDLVTCRSSHVPITKEGTMLAPITPIKIVTFDELNSLWGIRFSRQHLHRLERAKQFPIRVKIGKHHIGWIESEIVDYVAARVAMRSG
jgi:predicted DNA-binding transcriptional regulator AlpA